MASVVVVLSFHSDSLKRDCLDAYVKAAKYYGRVVRAIGIAQSTRNSSEMMVLVEDGPFVASVESDRQTAEFLSSLKTIEEKPSKK